MNAAADIDSSWHSIHILPGQQVQGCHGLQKSGNVRKFCLKSGKIFINEMVNLVMKKSGNFVLYQE